MSYVLYHEKLINECNDVPDFWEIYNLLGLHQFSNTTDKDKRKCFLDVYGDVLRGDSFCDCPLACKEIEYKTLVIRDAKSNKSEWEIYLLDDDTKVTEIIEVPDYTIEDCLAATGGILGLAIGASCLSVVELFVYLALRIVRKVY